MLTGAFMTITQEILKQKLHYNPDTGYFYWNKTGGINAGDVAGCEYKMTSGKTYIIIGINRTRYLAHRLVWLYMHGFFPEEIDHIDGNGANNRLNNLRNVSSIENRRNIRKFKNNTSGITGVGIDKRYNKWCAHIQIHGRKKSLGYFDNIFDAACARISAQQQYGFHENHGSDRPL